MMKFKKFLAAAMTGAMMFGLVATAAPAVSAIAAEVTPGPTRTDITLHVYYEDAVLEISAPNDNFISLEVLKMSGDTVKGVSNSYTYQVSGGSVCIDLSFLNLSKGASIRVKGDSDNFTNWTPVKTFAAQGKKDSIKFAVQEKNGVLDIATSFTTKTGAFNPADYQFKTLYGTYWQEMDGGFDIDTTVMAGTTLMLRKRPVESSTTQPEGSFAGAEVKVKIPAAPKAPKVKVDYKNAEIEIPANALYKVLYTVTASAVTTTTTGSSITQETDWNKSSAKEKLAPSKIIEKFDKDTQLQNEKDSLLTNGFTVAVRTASDTSKKKAASNIAFVTVGGAKKGDVSGKTITVGTATLTWKLVENSKKDEVELSATGGDFEYKIGSDKYKTVKVGKSAKVKEAIGKEITVRTIGDKKKEVFPSQEIKFTPQKAAVKSVEVKVKSGSSSTVTKPTNDPTKVEFEVTVKDEDDKTVSNPTVEWTLDDASKADKGVSIDGGIVTITKDVTVTEVTVTATVDGKSGIAKITIQ